MKYWWQRLGLVKILFSLVLILSEFIKYDLIREQPEIILIIATLYLFISGTILFVYGDE